MKRDWSGAPPLSPSPGQTTPMVRFAYILIVYRLRLLDGEWSAEEGDGGPLARISPFSLLLPSTWPA